MYDTMMLRDVIDALRKAESGATVQFDFCYTAPTSVASYRGFYDHLAIGWESPDFPKYDGTYWPTVDSLIFTLESAIGKRFHGYKGGEYTMSDNTPLWVANWGESGSTAIDRIECDGSTVIIHTKHVGY